jgi:hypothetical protein
MLRFTVTLYTWGNILEGTSTTPFLYERLLMSISHYATLSLSHTTRLSDILAKESQ